jgi:hypothetical protein
LKLRTGLGNLCIANREGNGDIIRVKKEKILRKCFELNEKEEGKIEQTIKESNKKRGSVT